MDNGRCLPWASQHPCVYCRPGLQEVCSAPVFATLVCRGLRGQVARMVLAPIEAIESQGGRFLWSIESYIRSSLLYRIS